MMIVRSANHKDLDFLLEMDKHISYESLQEAIEGGRIYILEEENQRIGWLRYNLFWDNTPFLNMLFILKDFRKKGYGRTLVEYWETQMKNRGYTVGLTSTLVHEDAIHFYMQFGYQPVGGFHPNEEEYEIILKKVF
ncbi:MAG: GNAT family N-acetyltransferase [Anaeroplasmataceae bacterium]|nr:GNAT family N-acetyltransferase [Anaeroplasmataceae bacterium]